MTATYSAGQQLWCSGCAAAWRFGEHGTICPNCGKTGGITSLVGKHEHQGRLGTWAQGDCIFFPGAEGVDACEAYRVAMARADIAISTHQPDGLRVRELTAEVDRLRRVVAAARDVVARRSRARAVVPWSLDEGLRRLSEAVTALAEAEARRER